jgi:hypothetical protein
MDSSLEVTVRVVGPQLQQSGSARAHSFHLRSQLRAGGSTRLLLAAKRTQVRGCSLGSEQRCFSNSEQHGVHSVQQILCSQQRQAVCRSNSLQLLLAALPRRCPLQQLHSCSEEYLRQSTSPRSLITVGGG